MNNQEKSKFIQRVKDSVAAMIAEVGGVPPILLVYKNGIASAVMLDVQNDTESLDAVARWRHDHEAVAHVASGIVTECSENFGGELPKSRQDMLAMDQTTECMIVFVFFEGRIMSMYTRIIEAEDGSKSIGEWRNETWVQTDEITFNLDNITPLQ